LLRSTLLTTTLLLTLLRINLWWLEIGLVGSPI